MAEWIPIIAVAAAVVAWRLRHDPDEQEPTPVADDLPPDIRRDLHSDAVRLNKQQLWVVLSAVVLAAIALPFAFIIGGHLLMRAIIAAAAVLAWAIRTCLEWRRLRQVDPYRYE